VDCLVLILRVNILTLILNPQILKNKHNLRVVVKDANEIGQDAMSVTISFLFTK